MNAQHKKNVPNCRYDMGKKCYPDECQCDEDITDITEYEHLRDANEFCRGD